ncbi:MAG: hypothetical protein ACKV19_22360 [Verrucomicrobiales bacterium]
MKLEYFFFGLFALLLAATGMLAMHYRGEMIYERRLNALARQAPAIPHVPAAAPVLHSSAPAPAPAAAVDQATLDRAALQRQLEQAETENSLLSSTVKKMQNSPESGLPPDAAVLTATQVRIKEAPSIAKVQEYHPDQGFAVIDAGSARGLKTGQVYAVRRGHFIVAQKVEVGETVEESQAILAVNASALQPGETLKPGDEVIKWE